MEYMEALNWIHSRLPFGSRPGLTRIEALLELIDHPEKKIKTIHVGGTNGKGSTVTFLRCLLEAQGLKVGTFTSPYITAFNERISINNQQIPNQDLVALVEKFQPLVAQLDASPELKGATEFEIITAMMFDYFFHKEVDVAIVEVGLGGTLDCTNVITPLVSCITTIGLDHVDILGNTIEEIARQKAGIIKRNRPVITGKIGSLALEIIEEKAVEMTSRIYSLGNDYVLTNQKSLGVQGEEFDFRNELFSLERLMIPMIGHHQTENAGMAIEVYGILGEMLGYQPNPDIIRDAIKKAHWAGRMEKIQDAPLILLDGAHNEPAIEVLVKNLENDFPNRKIHTIFAAIQTKDSKKMLELLSEVNNQTLYVTTFNYPKAYPIEGYPLAEFPKIKKMSDWQEGLIQLRNKLSSDDMVVVTGSLYFISQVREFLLR